MPLNLRYATADEEQAWNDRRLAARVCAPALALWAYRARAVVLGQSQRDAVATHASTERHGIPIVRRRSGGGAMLVGPGVLGISVLLPLNHSLVRAGLVPAYEWFGHAHARALRRLGIACEAVRPEAARSVRTSPSVTWACFGGLSPWEVVTLAGRRKLVGLAQRRARTGVLLVSGTPVADPQWDALCHVLGQPLEAAAILRQVTSSCRREVGRRVALGQVAQAIARELCVALEAGDNHSPFNFDL